jgi:inorganic pyrophosphatase
MMMAMKVVTSGKLYLDIDAYACCVAYAELLNLQGQKAVAASGSILNESITPTVRSWGAQIETDYQPAPDDTFVLTDVSEPEHFDPMVDVDRVVEIIDHHPGLEAFWEERIGDGANIEFIGAACTQVYESWKKAGLLDKMSVTSARLLICGILDNTLNFGAKVSTERDEAAYHDLLTRADLPEDWTAQYFSECQESILADAVNAIKNDTKQMKFQSYPETIAVGQLVVWDGKQVFDQHANVLRETMASIRPDWLINLVSIKEGKSYFISINSAVQEWVSELLGVQFEGDVALAGRLWLRKEIIKRDLNQ